MNKKPIFGELFSIQRIDKLKYEEIIDQLGYTILNINEHDSLLQKKQSYQYNGWSQIMYNLRWDHKIRIKSHDLILSINYLVFKNVCFYLSITNLVILFVFLINDLSLLVALLLCVVFTLLYLLNLYYKVKKGLNALGKALAGISKS